MPAHTHRTQTIACHSRNAQTSRRCTRLVPATAGSRKSSSAIDMNKQPGCKQKVAPLCFSIRRASQIHPRPASHPNRVRVPSSRPARPHWAHPATSRCTNTRQSWPKHENKITHMNNTHEKHCDQPSWRTYVYCRCVGSALGRAHRRTNVTCSAPGIANRIDALQRPLGQGPHKPTRRACGQGARQRIRPPRPRTTAHGCARQRKTDPRQRIQADIATEATPTRRTNCTK